MPPRQPPRRGGSGRPSSGGGKPASSGRGQPARGSGRPSSGRSSDRRDGPPSRGEPRQGTPSRGGKPPARGGKPPAKRASTGRPERRTDRSARGRPDETEASNRPKKHTDDRTKSWGGVAKRGVGKLKPSEAGTASEAWRKAAKESDKRERGRMGGARAEWQPEEWIDAGPVRDEARKAVSRGAEDGPRRQRKPKELPEDVKREVAQQAGPAWAGRVQDRLQDAVKAFERERFRDALKLLAPLSERAPGSAAVRELHGLTLYRLGRWRAAIKELEVAELLSGSVDQHPVLMDCHRALGRLGDVERLWDDLRKGGAGVETITEGRIVLAGAIADSGRARDAVTLLEQGPVNVRKPKDHHLRLWYALAATYERAGDVPRARQLFRRVLEADPDFADVEDRYDALS